LVVVVVCSSWALVRAWEEKAVAPAEKKGAVAEEPGQALARELVVATEANAAMIRKALLTKTKVNAEAVPLEALLEKLAKEHGLQLAIDKPALSDEGVQLDSPISLQLADVTLRSALRLILDPLKLTTIIEDEVLTVTTAQRAGENLDTRVYDVRKLVFRNDYTQLIETITSCVQPESWDEVGGPGSVREYRVAEAVVVRQTEDVHDEIASLLRELDRNLKIPPAVTITPLAPDPIRDAELAIRQTLTAKCSVSAREQPLGRVLKNLAEEHQFPLWIDRAALSDEGVDYDVVVTLDLHDVRLDSALSFMLRKLQLTWVIEDEVLKVMTTQKAGEKLVTRVYEVGDLVVIPTEELHWPPSPGFNAFIGGIGGARTKGPHGVGVGMGGGYFAFPELHLKQGFGPASAEVIPAMRAPTVLAHGNQSDFTELIELITSMADPESWDEVGGPGSVREFAPNLLVVRQTQAIHEKIDALLHRLRSVEQAKLQVAANVEPEDPNVLTLFVYHFTGSYSYSTEDLAKLIPETVARASWKPAGGEGTLIVQPTSLVIRQTPDVHRQIVKLLYDVVLQAK
jgi:hypothetical protein